MTALANTPWRRGDHATLDAEHSATADAIADQLSWMTGLTPATIQRLQSTSINDLLGPSERLR